MECNYIQSWQWGHRETTGLSKNLPDNEKISILMYHSDNIFGIIKKYDPNYYVWINQLEYD